MHDQMFAGAIIKALDAKFGEQGFPGKVTVTVTLVPTTHVSEDNLRSAFDSQIDKQRFPGVILVVERKKLEVKCGKCAAISAIDKPIFSCPSCGCGDLTLLDCEEFAVKSIVTGTAA